MLVMTRRRALGLLAGGTVAAAAVARKPLADEMLDISSLVPTDPPRPMPALHFLDAEGTEHSLADFAGHGIVLNLWATWCVPCVAELPALDRLAGELAGEVPVLALSSDRGGAPAVEAFYKAHAINHLAVWLDPHGDALHALNARGIPTTLIIDKQSRERGRLEGAVDWAQKDALATVRRLAG